MPSRKLQTNRGFTLVEIMIVVVIIGILVSVAVPQFYKARESARKSRCLGNLKILDNAKEQWAMDHKKKNGDPCDFNDLIGQTLYIKAMPECPSGGTYTVNSVSNYSSCTVAGHELPVGL